MRRSSERILTTHAGSLPRPENPDQPFVRRSRGEGIASDEIAAAGRAALRAIVPMQAETGIDVGNNGEQQRDSFFLYLKDRLTGLGGTWQRPSRADVDRYPEFKKRWIEQTSSKARVSPNEGLPMAIGDVRYIDPAAIEAECGDFADVLKDNPDIFVESFMNAPSPGIVAAAIKNQHYDTELKYLQALGEALRIEYETIVRAGFVLQIDAPDLALERHISFQGQAAVGVYRIRRKCRRSDQRRAQEHPTRPGAPPRLLGQFGIASRQRRAARRIFCRPCSKRTSGPCIFPSPARATRTNFAASRIYR